MNQKNRLGYALIITLLPLLLLFSNCASKTSAPAPGEIIMPGTSGKNKTAYEGWGCAPIWGTITPVHRQRCSKRNYWYRTLTSKASNKSIDAGKIADMKSSCKRGAGLKHKGDGMDIILGRKKNKKGTKVEKVSGYTKPKIQSIGIYHCCPLNPETGYCYGENQKQIWARCVCVGYAKFQGGRKVVDRWLGKTR